MKRQTWRTITASPLVLLAWLTATACGKDSTEHLPRAPADAVPAKVHVDGAELQIGVELGKVRNKLKLDAFSISRLPTTVAQYEQCVRARVCDEPSSQAPVCNSDSNGVDGNTYRFVTSAKPELAGGTAVTCVTGAQAK